MYSAGFSCVKSMAPRLCLTVATLHAYVYMRTLCELFWVGNRRVSFLTLNSAHQLSRCRFRYPLYVFKKSFFIPPSHLFSCCSLDPMLFRCAENVSFCTDTVVVPWRSADGGIFAHQVPYLALLAEHSTMS